MPLVGGLPRASAPEGIGLKARRKGFAFTSLAGTPAASEAGLGAGVSHTKHGSTWSAGGLGCHRCPGDASVDPSTVRKTSRLLPCASSTAPPWPCSLSKPPPWSPLAPLQARPGFDRPCSRADLSPRGLAWPCVGTPGLSPSLSSFSFTKTISTASPVTICQERHYLTFPTMPVTHLFCNWKSAPRNRPSISLLPTPL